MERAVKQGYESYTNIVGGSIGAKLGEEYISELNSAINILNDDINVFSGYNTPIEQLKGDIAEFWHSDTFNINAKLNDSNFKTLVDRSHNYASADITSIWGDKFGLKYLRNGTETAKCDRCEKTDTVEDEGSATGHIEVIDEAEIDSFLSKNKIDKLNDEGITMNDVKNNYRIVYYYDLESMMTNTELNMMNIIKDTRFNVNDNVKDIILNRYYEEYNGILNDGMFDIFKYNGSTIKETGFSGNTRLIRPVIKAKLVEKDSLEDSYKPEIFNRKTFKSLVIEQRYEMLFDKDNSEDESRFLDMKSKLNQRNVYYTVQNVNKYMIKHTTDNIRYAITETEKEIVDKYNDMLGMVGVKDVDKSFKKGIFDVLDNEYNFNNETRTLMKDLVEFDLSEAFANRLLKINVLEMSNTITRIEYLKHIEG